MISVAEARAALREAVAPLAAVEVPLAEAAGRVLAETVTADRDAPATVRLLEDRAVLSARTAARLQVGEARFDRARQLNGHRDRVAVVAGPLASERRLDVDAHWRYDSGGSER